MSRKVEDLLEFDKLQQIVSGFSTCVLGRQAVLALKPSEDRAALETEFVPIREAIGFLRSGAELGFGGLTDPQEWLGLVAIPTSVLGATELLQSASLMNATAMLREIFRGETGKYPALTSHALALLDFRSLATAIQRAILPNGEIHDDASPQLRRARASLSESRERIRSSLASILRTRGQTSGEDYVTLRNDRFVIPIRASERRGVPGVVHGASATGQTIFVEPLETIDLNNRLVQLAEEEAEEIARILADLTERVRGYAGPLNAAARTIAHLDSVFARARFAREYDCVVPEFTDTQALRVEMARNPVLEATLRPLGRKAVPLSLSLGTEETILVISGPNTGGKTVALKTVGLAALSAQSAIPVAADKAEMPIFDHVLADIGDEQSIAADLSTFSAHILNLKRMLETASDRSLVLVDEMGTGTAPEEGAALAMALLEEFRKRRALTIATTHHDRLKSYASTTPGIRNAAMEFDEENLRPTYRLLVGLPGSSSGIEIARRLGLAENIVEYARANLSPESREARGLIAYLHRSRDEMEEMQRQVREEREQLEMERRELKSEWIERQRKRIQELERSFAETQKRLESEMARLTADIKDRAVQAQLEKQAGRRLGKISTEARADVNASVVEALAASQADLGTVQQVAAKPVALEQLMPGQKIIVKGFKQPIIFRRHDGRNAEVEAGPLRMKVALTDITGIDSGGQTGGSLNRGVTVRSRPSDEPAAEEINVIGCTVDEATSRVDKFLDVAALAGKPSVRIIHGYGTGSLRRGLAGFLSTHPLVDRIHPEAQDRGGEAITVAELKA